jgi:inorganic pyrophosphatase
MLDRVLYSSVHYPANYGFIPQSYGDDRDPLDILVLCQESVSPLCMVKARIIGVMRMMDRGEGDEKILAVAEGDPSLSHVRDLNNLPDHFLQEVRNFFETYKILENKTVAIDALSDRATALPIVEGAFAKYRDEILPGLKG